MTKVSKRIEKWYNLKGKTVFLTGATGMLGKYYSNVLSEVGCNVIIVDLDKNKCNSIAEELNNKYNVNAFGMAIDITNKNEVFSGVSEIVKRFNNIDILINNAAAEQVTYVDGKYVEFENFPLELWQSNMAVNLTGPFLCCQAIGKEMIRQGKGVILNIGSVYGVVACDQRIYGDSKLNSSIAYATTKSGILNFTRYLASYWQGKNIRVNCLSPGGIHNNQKKEFVEQYKNRTMLKRMGDKDDLGSAMLYLISDSSKWVTGTNLIVDGGWTAW